MDEESLPMLLKEFETGFILYRDVQHNGKSVFYIEDLSGYQNVIFDETNISKDELKAIVEVIAITYS